MNFFANKWLAEWLQGLGRITLLCQEAVHSLFTRKIIGRDLK